MNRNPLIPRGLRWLRRPVLIGLIALVGLWIAGTLIRWVMLLAMLLGVAFAIAISIKLFLRRNRRAEGDA